MSLSMDYGGNERNRLSVVPERRDRRNGVKTSHGELRRYATFTKQRTV